jgi:hypothetical protein
MTPQKISGEELEKEYKNIEFQFIRRFKKKPSLEAVLLLIGYQESPEVKEKHSKEEKLDLINLGLLTALETQGLFLRKAIADGWPLFDAVEGVQINDMEETLRAGIVAYFKKHNFPE